MKKKKTRTDRCVLEMTWLFVVVSLQCSRYIFDFTVSRSRRFVIRLSFACLCIYLYKHLSVLHTAALYIDAQLARAENRARFFSLFLSLSFFFSSSLLCPCFLRTLDRIRPLCTAERPSSVCVFICSTHTLEYLCGMCCSSVAALHVVSHTALSHLSDDIHIILNAVLNRMVLRTHTHKRTHTSASCAESAAPIHMRTETKLSQPDRSFNILLAHLTSPKTIVGETHLFNHTFYFLL